MEETVKVIVFTLNNQRYGADIKQVMSIEKMKEITKVPGTSDFIKGIISLHGETVPVLDLKERLQIAQTKESDLNRIIVVQVDGIQVGLIVDAATDVMDVDSSVIETAKEMGGMVHKDYIKGVAKLENELLILLDLANVLALTEKEELKEVMEH
ncbi:chemotaxis protein CheW [Paucisalibacillus globulus]|jgi:purine-binding chemotaxis protein CheW|uniref:chemotaxis protein CheW n=1 Tax=Paucisalibacillus globulus TaxID=351095 RepID=UPI0004033BF3|nr:chemotaxis protein CheW [Paucisalibacillus globulus]